MPAHTVLKAGLIAATFAAACGAAPTSPSSDSGAETCTGYPAWQTSAYVLPYPVGTAYRVAQGNCSAPGNGHRGTERYSYDWEMSIGTPFSAVRAGTVVHVETSHLDGQVATTGFDNYIVIRHPDGTHALYGHLTHDGATVREGDTVTQGQPLGLSGNTGNTNNFPHLHVSVHGCDPVVNGSAACATQPVTFRNTEANPSGLIVDRRYTALPY